MILCYWEQSGYSKRLLKHTTYNDSNLHWYGLMIQLKWSVGNPFRINAILYWRVMSIETPVDVSRCILCVATYIIYAFWGHLSLLAPCIKRANESFYQHSLSASLGTSFTLTIYHEHFLPNTRLVYYRRATRATIFTVDITFNTFYTYYCKHK